VVAGGTAAGTALALRREPSARPGFDFHFTF